MTDQGPRSTPPGSLCAAHNFAYREIEGETWNVCVRCGFGELWAAGTLIKSTDMAESNRLDGWNLESGVRR